MTAEVQIHKQSRISIKYTDTDSCGAILVFHKMGSGSVIYWGARWIFSDNQIGKHNHLQLWDNLINLHWNPSWKARLQQRMLREQRHRLLHGYPMTAGLVPYTVHPRQSMNLLRRKRNAIGIIPHTFCNTGKRGCGFCTFHMNNTPNLESRPVCKRFEKKYKSAKKHRAVSPKPLCHQFTLEAVPPT